MSSKQEQIEECSSEDALEVNRRFEAVAYWGAREDFCGEATQPTLKFWANLSRWTLEEAVALTLNHDPKRFIDPAVGKGLLEKDPNVEHYHYIQEHIKRAVQAGELTDPVQPGVYVAWAKKRNLDFPEVLAKLVPAATADNQNTPAKSTKTKDKSHIALTREKNTLLNLFFGVVVDFYGYDPTAARSPVPKQLEQILRERGIRVSDDTIRKYLQEALEVLPDDFQAPKPNSVK